MVGIKGALKIKGVPNLLLGFFSYCALGISSDSVGSSYLVGAKGISAERAAAFASLFCIGITLGRFLAENGRPLYSTQKSLYFMWYVVRPQDDSSVKRHRYHSCRMYRYVVTGIHR